MYFGTEKHLMLKKVQRLARKALEKYLYIYIYIYIYTVYYIKNSIVAFANSSSLPGQMQMLMLAFKYKIFKSYGIFTELTEST